MNRIKTVQIIRSLEKIEVWHECLDIIEEDLEEILVEYGVFADLTDDEAQIVRDYLMERAEQAEFREAVRWAHSEDELLLLIPNRFPFRPRRFKPGKADKKAKGSQRPSLPPFLAGKNQTAIQGV